MCFRLRRSFRAAFSPLPLTSPHNNGNTRRSEAGVVVVIAADLRFVPCRLIDEWQGPRFGNRPGSERLFRNDRCKISAIRCSRSYATANSATSRCLLSSSPPASTPPVPSPPGSARSRQQAPDDPTDALTYLVEVAPRFKLSIASSSPRAPDRKMNGVSVPRAPSRSDSAEKPVEHGKAANNPRGSGQTRSALNAAR